MYEILMQDKNHRLSIERVTAATHKIDPVFLHTPQFKSDSLSELLDLSLVVKVETINPIGCFKGRGTEVILADAASDMHFVCASAGNFGQAMAYSCRKKGRSLTVYANMNANALKVDRMRSLGARVVLFGDDFDSAKLEAKRKSEETNARFVEDSLDIGSLEGAGTIALELLQYPLKLDTLLIPLGNGALCNGVGRVFKCHQPDTRMVAIQSRGASAMVDSWRAAQVIQYATASTIADGIAVRIPVPQALKDMDGVVDEAILVEDGSIIRAMQLIHEHLGIVSEPSGAVGLAAILENPLHFKDRTVGIIICGGNLTNEQKKMWLPV